MIGVIRSDTSNLHSLSVHTNVSWPDFLNPLVLLLLYYTLVALLHKWVHVTEKVRVCVSESKVIWDRFEMTNMGFLLIKMRKIHTHTHQNSCRFLGRRQASDKTHTQTIMQTAGLF